MKIIYMWTAIEETNIKAILADMNTTELVVKIWKKKLRPVRDLNPEVMGGHGRSWVQIPYGLEFFFRPYFHY